MRVIARLGVLVLIAGLAALRSGSPVAAGGLPNGDVNHDGTTNAIDAALVLQYGAGLLPSIDANGDVNVDGDTNSIDAALILQYGAGLLPGLPQIPMPAIDGQPTVMPSGLAMYDIRVGTGAEAATRDTVTVNYASWLASGVLFDASSSPVQFPLSALIAGWQEGVPGMKVGGQRRLIIPPHLAYGDQGSGDIIPPNATVIFDIELISIP